MARGAIKDKCVVCGATKVPLIPVTFEVTKKVKRNICGRCKSSIK